jgi:hypothetical protein
MMTPRQRWNDCTPSRCAGLSQGPPQRYVMMKFVHAMREHAVVYMQGEPRSQIVQTLYVPMYIDAKDMRWTIGAAYVRICHSATFETVPVGTGVLQCQCITATLVEHLMTEVVSRNLWLNR